MTLTTETLTYTPDCEPLTLDHVEWCNYPDCDKIYFETAQGTRLIQGEGLLKEINEFHSAISNELLQSKDKNIQSAILKKTMLDSFGRIGSYSGDIAEIAINMSAGSLTFDR